MAFERVKRTRRGDFQLRIPVGERDVLRTLPATLRTVLIQGDPVADPAMRRLFPSAYLDDEAAAEEFDGVVRDDLVEGRMKAIETMERTIDADRVTEDELVAWLAAINDLRLVLGVRLSVTEESRPEEFAGDEETERAFALYSYLSFLEEGVVEALSKG